MAVRLPRIVGRGEAALIRFEHGSAGQAPPGTVVGGRFRIERLLGEGGYGCVYQAMQLNLSRGVALKIMHADVLKRPAALARFEREAVLTQQLSHPNIVRLFDFGRTEQGIPFIVWELLVGRSLEREIATAGPLPAPRVRHIAEQAIKALMEAHSLGIVHRDVKPANVFLSDFAGEPDFVKVLDFGIALAPTGSGGITQDGVSLGTPAYMAPEQVLDQAVDGRTDIYALGLVMAEMLTGEPVFRGATAMQVAMMQIEERPIPLSPVVLGSPLGPVIVRATQKDPARRFSSAFEMLGVLRSAAQLSGAAPRPATDRTDLATGPTQIAVGAFDPTAGLATPTSSPWAGAGERAPTPTAVSPGQPPMPMRMVAGPVGPPTTLGAQVVMPTTSSSGRPLLLGIVVGAIGLAVLGGVGLLAFEALSPKEQSKRSAREEKRSRGEEAETDPFEEAIRDPIHVGPDGVSFRVPGATIKALGCDAVKELTPVVISGVDGLTLFRRAEALGYKCVAVTSNEVFGGRELTVSLSRYGGGAGQFTFREKLSYDGCQGGRLIKDPDTNENLCLRGFGADEVRRITAAMFPDAAKQ
jgi:serine/threonine-protein kinase